MDANASRLRENLAALLNDLYDQAERRSSPELRLAREWHRHMLDGVVSSEPGFAGIFRGEPDLEDAEVHIMGQFGTAAALVSEQLLQCITTLQRSVAALDSLIAPTKLPDADQLGAVLDLCGWVHAEWVRIHPFANGNGRIARIWVNWLGMRYGLPPFLRLQPRPMTSYAEAGFRAMQGDWRPSAMVLRQIFSDFVRAL